MTFTFLGTGHGNVSPERFQSSLLLRDGDFLALLDAGEPCAQRLRSLGIRPGDLDAVFLTHGHADHAGGMALLLQAMWGDGRDHPLPIFAPQDLLEAMLPWLQYTLSLLPPRSGFQLHAHAWVDGRTETTGPLAITPHTTSHLPPPREAFLLELKCRDRRMVCSGDIGEANDLEPHVREPADLLVCELAHVTPEALIPVLAGARIETLVLTHVAASLEERLGQLCLQMQNKLPGTGLVFAAEDGMAVEV
jgi:ribonuclease BN (tRNA processing enzyme)